MELCTYCFNRGELEDPDLDLVPCPMCCSQASGYVKDPVRLAEEAIKKVFGNE